MRFAAVVVSLGGAATGCTLPAQVGAGATMVVPYEGRVSVTPEVRTGFHPLQLVEDLQHRRVDAGMGMIVRWKDLGTPAVRPVSEIYAEATALDVAHDEGATEYSRRSYGGAVTFWPGKVKRFGAEAIMKQEIGLFLHENEDNTYAHGELTIGAYAALAFDTTKVTVSAGVMVRTPLALTLEVPEH